MPLLDFSHYAVAFQTNLEFTYICQVCVDTETRGLLFLEKFWHIILQHIYIFHNSIARIYETQCQTAPDGSWSLARMNQKIIICWTGQYFHFYVVQDCLTLASSSCVWFLAAVVPQLQWVVCYESCHSLLTTLIVEACLSTGPPFTGNSRHQNWYCISGTDEQSGWDCA